MTKIITLAHYYTSPEVQQISDKVGDSLDLALYAKTCQADVIIVAGVKFMAETVKILNPRAKVILIDDKATCSLVKMTDIGCFHPTPQKCKILKPSFLQT